MDRRRFFGATAGVFLAPLLGKTGLDYATVIRKRARAWRYGRAVWLPNPELVGRPIVLPSSEPIAQEMEAIARETERLLRQGEVRWPGNLVEDGFRDEVTVYRDF